MQTALLVCGSAPCVHADLAAAKALYPVHEVMTINGACTVVPEAQHMLCGHTALSEDWVKERKRVYPDRPIRVHAGHLVRHWNKHKLYPSVTDWWLDVSSGATSAGKAALIGLRMGFSPVILCGCPMDGGGYVGGEAIVPHDPGCARVGFDKNQNNRIIARYRERMAELALGYFAGVVFSMSGYSRRVLGAPPAISEYGVK